jgi:tetratricopeptide (TPR) repeat protein
MSWYSKIKSKIEKKDDSPELKRGQVKHILISEFERELPEFNFLESLLSDKKANDVNAFAEIDKDYYSIDPTSTPLYWHEGNSFYNSGAYDQALVFYQKGLLHNPYHVHVLNNIGSSYYALGDLKNAVKYFDEALRYNPNFVETLMNYSSLLFNTGEIDAAILKVLSVPASREPANYKMFLLAIAKAKYQLMIEKHSEPNFKKFLQQTIDDDAFLFEISRNCRLSNRSYEMELRHYFEKMTRT